jgi:hypothetical protein
MSSLRLALKLSMMDDVKPDKHGKKKLIPDPVEPNLDEIIAAGISCLLLLLTAWSDFLKKIS